MSHFWSPLVHTLTPYVAGEQTVLRDGLKLNTNENPYGPSPHALAAIAEAAADTLKLYPDSGSVQLRKAIAQSYDIDAGMVFVGNGSDEVLAHAFQALLNHEGPLLFPDITYSFYTTYCRLYGIDFRQIPVDADMQVKIADYDVPCGAIILPNPNAPTGSVLPLAEIERLIASHSDKVVVIDEAYVDFGGESAVPLVQKYPNLLVIQTFSKSRALAGLRVGFAIGQRPLIEALERVKDSFNSYPLDRLAIAGATAAWEDQEWFERHRDMIVASRERLSGSLRDMGFIVIPSATNFVFARHPQWPGADLASALRKHEILVRHFPKDRIGDFLRISIGTDAECDRLVATLQEVLGQPSV
ncbi:histidinol-phosphate transaminase [Mesorhizobium sp. NBSH29]|uniref:histidinol-phosphate transaminase n=1 Tax=Mesorhizobium sp. NBSH29 TaxID=2654249 RepID=UPI00189646BB|nr:histidinol-phosphate transaminase [Mesorhizobium sp. NBSH29]QPC85989.1 histidinol-phosphate transaminase [Mesorhizobium sp. NBSH29]